MSRGATRRTAASGVSPRVTRSFGAAKPDVFGVDAGAPMRGGTRPSRSNAARRGLAAAKPPDTAVSASRARLSRNTVFWTLSSGTNAAGCGTGELRARFRSIVPAVSSSATTVPQNPRLSSSDSAVSGFFGESLTSILCGCSGKR